MTRPHVLWTLLMLVKTLKPNLLIGSTCYPLGAKVRLDNKHGKRLVDAGACVELLEDPTAPLETATVHPPSKAAKR